LKFDRFEWFGGEVGASVDGVGEVAAGLFEVAPPGEPERGDEGVADSLNLIFVLRGSSAGPGGIGSGAALEGGKAQVDGASAGGASFDLGEFVLGADPAG